MMAPCVAKYCLVSQGTVTRGAQREDAGGDSSRVHLFKQRRIVGDKVRRERRSTSADEHQPESDICAQCKDAGTIVMPTGEMYKVCAPEKWKSHECAAKQLVASKKPVSHVELSKAAKSSQRPA
jgi:hypothetical protein